MKVIISSFDNLENKTYGGGGAVVIHKMAKYLLEHKYDVTVISGKHNAQMPNKIEKVKYDYIGTALFGAKLSQFIYQVLLPFKLLTSNFDIWIESFTPPFSTAFLQLFTKKPVIGIAHFLDADAKSKEYKLPFYLIERMGLKTYKNFIVLSDKVKQKIRKYNKTATIEIIPNGVDIVGINQIKSNNKGTHLLYMGRIEIAHKGLDLLLKAYSLSKNSINLPLYIAGTGNNSDVKYLTNQIKSLNLEDRVKLLGKITGKDKVKLFKKAAIVVIPSRFETYPLVALEALAFGKPLLTFNIDGFKWLPDKYCVKVNPFKVSELGIMMRKMSNDHIKYQKMAILGNEYIRNFDWNLIFKKYLTYIEKVNYERSGDENPNYSRLFTR